MSFFPRPLLVTGALLVLLLSSCATKPKPKPGTHAHFMEREDYPKTSLHWKNVQMLDQVTPESTYVFINLKTQRGFLMSDEEVIIDYPICSGRKSHPTPKGVFKILEKKKEKSSNRYGRIYDAEGNLVNGDADIRTDEVPEGGKFVGASMPYWMRMTWEGIGHHVGPTKRVPVSHGCVRGPKSIIPLVYARVEKGSKVIVD
ncbi:MAG: L,D-transpeptidase family protein [Akkermansiaceae bacterium]|nr:L,D-transpeptidase family protein [Akkermansiaceae bacterium]